jgi:flagellar basal-body rod protein FlgB
MLDRMTQSIDFHGKALELRAQRQEVLSSNIANADTPGYKARDFDFASALRSATGVTAAASAAAGPAATTLPVGLSSGAGASVQTVALARSHQGHLPVGGVGGSAGAQTRFVVPEQGTLDGNTVDLNRERAQFADNALRYEASLRFINGGYRTMLSAIRGE